MRGKVFFSVSMSLDGFIAPESVEDLMGQQWMELQQWLFRQRFFRENLKLGEGGEEGRDNDIARETFERTGASVMGKRMFDAGEQGWLEEAPFHTPVFVVTHEKRDPWERPGGTTFHFVNDGIEPALDQAREAARDRDVRIAGGGMTILEYVNAGLIDHPLSGEPVVGFVVQGGARRKLANLRARTMTKVVFRSGWDWIAVDGQVDLVGPDDRLDGLAPEKMPSVFHAIYVAAIGGTAEEWAARDDVIEREGHTAVLVRPVRVYTNPGEAP